MNAMLKGVYLARKKDNSIYYRASITYRRKHISLGSFDTEDSANRAYEEADRLLRSETDTIDSYENTCALPFEKWVILLNFRDNGLSIAFDRAIVLGIAKKNPSRMVGNIKSKKTKVDFWTLEEFQKVISLLYKGDYYEHYLFISFWLLFMTVMRIGEAAALQWSDIDFETGLLNINKTLYYKSMDEYKFVDPKTQASVRTIYIDADTIRELKAWRAVQQKVLKGCGFILSYSGIPTSKHTLPRALEKLAGLAGVHRIKIHALRHSHASLLISMGENPLLIKERLGHEKIQTTLGTYGHLYPNTNLEVAHKLTGVLHYTPATQSIADYTSNQFTANYHRELE